GTSLIFPGFGGGWLCNSIDAQIFPCYPKLSRAEVTTPGSVSRCASGLHGRARWKPARVGLGVDEFVGNYTSRLDAKGRVSIPASFRAVLARDGYEGLYVHPSLDADAVDCGGNALLREIDDLLARLSPYRRSATCSRRLCSAPARS